MRGKEWTPQEDNRLLELVNSYQTKTGRRVRWELIPMGKFWRTPEALKNRWNHDLKHRIDMVDGQYVLPELTLFDKPEKPLPRPLRVPKKTTKTYLWGLYTVVREE